MNPARHMPEMDDFDYDLPGECIAQTPQEPRDAARMLVAMRGRIEHRIVRHLPQLIGPGDVVVVNDTKVIPARLQLRKASGGAVEVLLLERRPDGRWQALVRPGRRLPPGTVVSGETGIEVEIGERLDDGKRSVQLSYGGTNCLDDDSIERALQTAGKAPLPPYITTPLDDPGRYQTVYASHPGSVAAPTAGLHFTRELLAAIEGTGATVRRVDLTIGLDTFRPVTAHRPEDHVIHSERYSVDEATMTACARAERVIAVGTTATRALESAAATGELSGRTSLFIHGEYRFSVVDVLLTNFHLPRSSLLLLLDSFAGPRWRDLYREAMANGYRFLSFGDCMLVDACAGARRVRKAGPVLP